MKTIGSSTWAGTWRQGEGTLSTQTGIIEDQYYSYSSRFDGTPGGIPEELLAAAHAGCFNQALANACDKYNFKAESISTEVEIDLGFDDMGRPEVKTYHFKVSAKVPGATEKEFQDLAALAKASCAISKILKIETGITATLIA